jgi:hypothetical protein
MIYLLDVGGSKIEAAGCKAVIIIRDCAKSRMLKARILAETPTEEIGVVFLLGADCVSIGRMKVCQIHKS